MNLKELYTNNKKKLFVSAIIILAFALGYSLPSVRANKGASINNNIGIEPVKQQNNATEPTKAPEPTKQVKTQSPNTKMDAACPIKAKISAKGAKQYYMPGSMYYANTKAEKCFKTEAEAKAAGYVKSKR